MERRAAIRNPRERDGYFMGGSISCETRVVENQSAFHKKRQDFDFVGMT